MAVERPAAPAQQPELRRRRERAENTPASPFLTPRPSPLGRTPWNRGAERPTRVIIFVSGFRASTQIKRSCRRVSYALFAWPPVPPLVNDGGLLPLIDTALADTAVKHARHGHLPSRAANRVIFCHCSRTMRHLDKMTGRLCSCRCSRRRCVSAHGADSGVARFLHSLWNADEKDCTW